MQTSNSGRVVYGVVVSQGSVFVFNPGDTVYTSTTNNTGETPPLVYSGLVRSAANQQKLWFADGTNWCYYAPVTNSVETWAATSGTLPVDSSSNTPRLIATWRARTLLSGLLLDPQNLFASAVAVPTDFNYSPASQSPTQAWAANLAPFGLIGDLVFGLVPYTDDVLIIGGCGSIRMIQGDPMAGGTVGLISEDIGMAWGEAWCKDPYGTIYFYSNKNGIYTLVPGMKPQRISQQIEKLLQNVDTGANGIRLAWHDGTQSVHVFVTPLASAQACTHLCYEQRTGSWWTDTYENNNHNPLCCCTLDGNTAEDRVVLIGSWDGYLRFLDTDATTDDGYHIDSQVVIGPLTTKDLDDLMLKDCQAVLGETSSPVTFAIYSGATAELALASVPIATGTWTKGRNYNTPIRVAGHALYVSISSANPWQLEEIRVRVQAMGRVRGRRPV